MSSENTALSENSVKMVGVGSLHLAREWQRFLPSWNNDELRFQAWVRSDSVHTGIAWRLTDDAFTVQTAHSGSGAWELLEVVAQTSDLDPRLEPVLFQSANTTSYFNLPFVENEDEVVRQYPIPLRLMPNGPLQITSGFANLEPTEPKLSRYVGRQIVLDPPRFLTYQHPGQGNKFGVLDYSMLRNPPRQHQVLLLRGDGPLTVPTSTISSEMIEVNDSEAVLLASLAARHLLERASTGLSPATVRPYLNRLSELNQQIDTLTGGAGSPRNVATYGLGW